MIKNLCVAAIRLFALYLGIISGLQLLTILSFSLSSPSSPSFEDPLFNPSILPACITFALAVGLWVFSGAIAERIAPAPKTGQNIAVDAQDFVLIGLCLLGAAALIDSLPHILNTMIKLAVRTAPFTDNHHTGIDYSIVWSDRFSPGLVENTIRAIVGFGFLFFGFRLKSVLRKFQTLRTKGHDKAEPISASETSERS